MTPTGQDAAERTACTERGDGECFHQHDPCERDPGGEDAAGNVERDEVAAADVVVDCLVFILSLV